MQYLLVRVALLPGLPVYNKHICMRTYTVCGMALYVAWLNLDMQIDKKEIPRHARIFSAQVLPRNVLPGRLELGLSVVVA